MHSQYKKLGRTSVAVCFKILVGFIGLTFALVLSLRWIPPPTSAFMLQHQVSALLIGKGNRRRITVGFHGQNSLRMCRVQWSPPKISGFPYIGDSTSIK